MHKFYFNECLPIHENRHDFIAHFSEVLRAFVELKNENLAIENAIITEKLPSKILLSNVGSLAEIIENIEDRNLKRIAFSLFNKYPIEAHFSSNPETEAALLANNFSITIGEKTFDALNLAIVAQNEGFLFSIPLHDDLKNHQLCLVSLQENRQVFVDNFYGENDNIDAIRQKITTLNARNSSTFDQLKQIFRSCYYKDSFEKLFYSLSLLEQQSIIDEFEKAKNRQLLSPFYPDTKIIKDVSPKNGKCKVYELRVYSPTALRVYFHEGEKSVHLASIQKKSNPDQNADIKKAHDIIYKSLATEV